MLAASAEIRRANVLRVVRDVYLRSPVSRAELTGFTGLSLASVASMVTDLLRAEFLSESEPDRSRPGRPFTRLAMNPARGLVLGIDVSATSVHAEIYNTNLVSLNQQHERLADGEGGDPEVVTAKLRSMISSLLAATPELPLLGAGVSVTGQIDVDNGIVTFSPSLGWRDVPFAAMVADIVSAPVYLDNDLKAMASAELWTADAPGTDNLVLVRVSNGVGAGIVLDGALYRGRANTAGEWGHTSVVYGGRDCPCGANGCLEAYVGAMGIIATLRELDPASALIDEDDTDATIGNIARAAQEGERAAREAVERTAEYLGVGLANIVNFVNPDLIVLTGEVCDLLGEQLRLAAEQTMRRQALAGPLAPVRIQRREGGLRSLVCRGGAVLALEGALQHATN
jgi:predicted NBD/HSP70 family sugar kinase